MANFENILSGSTFYRNGEYDPRGDEKLRIELFRRWKDATDEIIMTRRRTGALASAVEGSEEENNKMQQEWFDRLYEKHSERTRFYHTPVHLVEMLSCFDMVLQNQQQQQQQVDVNSNRNRNNLFPRELFSFERQIVILAIFFHDAIYDVHSNTNEEDSAKLFQEFILQVTDNIITNSNSIDSSASVPESFVSNKVDNNKQENIPTIEVVNKLEFIIVQFILATKQHNTDTAVKLLLSKVEKSNDDNNADEEAAQVLIKLLNLFLDLDMAVLGKHQKAYWKYAAFIRKEYEFVPHEIYCEKRAEILENFLKQKTIYGTSTIRDALEHSARSNLTLEIESLKKGQIPGGDLL